MLFFLGVGFAIAGELAQGFQDIPYGDPSPLANAPLPSCTRAPNPDTWWVCDHTLGTVPVKVSFVRRADLYVGFFVYAVGRETCADVLEAIQAIYGNGDRKNVFARRTELADRTWSDGAAFGSFEYSESGARCEFLGGSTAVVRRATREEGKRAD